ncbi:MAG: hypothetical protein ABIE43_05090 [Patescibacteria group bacterium]
MLTNKKQLLLEKLDNFFSGLISAIVALVVYKIIDINIFLMLPIVAIAFLLARPYVRKYRITFAKKYKIALEEAQKNREKNNI